MTQIYFKYMIIKQVEYHEEVYDIWCSKANQPRTEPRIKAIYMHRPDVIRIYRVYADNSCEIIKGGN